MLHDANTTGDLLGLGRYALRKPTYRKHIGLPAIKIGKQLMFDDEDIESVIKACRERFDDKSKAKQGS